MLKVSVEDIGPPLGRDAFAKYLCAPSLSLFLSVHSRVSLNDSSNRSTLSFSLNIEGCWTQVVSF